MLKTIESIFTVMNLLQHQRDQLAFAIAQIQKQPPFSGLQSFIGIFISTLLEINSII